MLKKSSLLFLSLIVFSTVIEAQVNMESYRHESSNFEGAVHRLDSDFQYASGNSSYKTVRLQWRTDYNAAWGRSFIVGNMKFGRSSSSRFIDQHFLHARVIRQTDLVALEFFLQQESNTMLHVNKRQLIGSGIRVPLYNQYRLYSKLKMFLGLGLMLEYEKENGVPNIGRSAKSTNYVSYVWDYSSQLNLSATLYYQFALEDHGDYRVLLDQELSFQISELISILLGGHYRYEERPFKGIEKRDVELRNGVRVTF